MIRNEIVVCLYHCSMELLTKCGVLFGILSAIGFISDCNYSLVTERSREVEIENSRNREKYSLIYCGYGVT